MKKEMKLLPPTMPNFISIERPSVSSWNISIAELSEDEAKEYANLMRDTFLIHWKQKTNQKCLNK